MLYLARFRAATSSGCNVIPSGSGVRIPYLGEDNFGDLGEVSDAAGEPREDRCPSRYHAVQDGHPEVREK